MRGRKRNYKAYVRDYQSMARKLSANEVQMREEIYTEEEFNTQYERLLNQRKEEVMSGERKTTGNIVRTLIDKQATSLSSKQVQAIEETKKQGKNYWQLRAGHSIKEAYNEFKREWEQTHPEKIAEAALYAKHMISDEFFGGSP